MPVPHGADDEFLLAGPVELRIELDRPAYVYPMFEQALRIAAGETPDAHRRRIGELWARFSAVAQDNPHAWNRNPVSAEEIWQPGPGNRMISWPYTKLMNSNNMVDQGAALILTSAEKATHLQIPADRWVFPYAGTDAHDTYLIGERAEFDRSPAIRIAGRRALELAGIGVDDVDLVDVYSCFPSAVQVAARELGLPLDDPAPATDRHRRPDLRGRAVEQLRHRTRSPRWPSGWWPRPARSASSPPTAATSPSTASASTAPSRRAPSSVGRTYNPPSTPSPPGWPRRSGGRRHRRDVDHAVHPGRRSREGVPRRAHARRHPRAGGAHRRVRGRGEHREDIAGAKVRVERRRDRRAPSYLMV